ncbi:MAG TPA: hypothetical protein PKA55_05260 [Rhodoblastus sp.]|nr:hypothetical protein [Rhodoblastus sp.]
MAALLASAAPLHAQSLPALKLTIEGRAEKVFDTATDKCAPVDMPDVNPRAYRAADGSIVMFALHFEARPLRGPDFAHLKIDCHVALHSGENADPATYDGRRYVTSTWTADGRRVAALIHDEYHADRYPGRCLFDSDLQCWWNTVLSFRSDDGGANFAPSKPLVVAAAPFRQDIGQGRHRGFFNPSNMVGKDGYVYVFVSTTGWEGQHYGACLIRNRDPMDSAGWRGFDGQKFSVRWRDPYAGKAAYDQAVCKPLEPFGFPVGAVVRHRASGTWIALWEAPRVEGKYPTAGFYYATSRDLATWSLPALLAATRTMHQGCDAGGGDRDGAILSYPSLLDEKAQGRNFDDVGDEAWIFYTRIRTNGCAASGERMLMRQRVVVNGPAVREKAP